MVLYSDIAAFAEGDLHAALLQQEMINNCKAYAAYAQGNTKWKSE